MLTEGTAIRAYFAKLGLEQEIADLYLALHAHGPQNISQLARTSRVERTRIYRLIDKLLESNLVELEAHSARGVIKAAPIANLHILINQKEQELKSLQDELGLIEQVLARNSLSSPALRVQLYHGPEGVRQMLWNELEAKTAVVGFDGRSLEDTVGKPFMQRWTAECTKRQVVRELSTAPQGATFCSHVYGDVIASYHWKDGEVTGLEIHSQELAEVQRQLYLSLNNSGRCE